MNGYSIYKKGYNSTPLEEQECFACGKKFRLKNNYSYKQRASRRFCSAKCSGRASLTILTKLCLNCGKEFKIHKCRIKIGSGKFCSKECSSALKIKTGSGRGINSPSWKGGPQPVVCKVCGITFFTEYNQRNLAKYCSRACQHKGLIGRKHSESSLIKIRALSKSGAESPLWKGGPKKNCPACGTVIKKSSEYCQKHKSLTSGYKKGRIKQSFTIMGKIPINIQRPGRYGNIQRGYFDINGKNLFFRSKWEANYALYLDFLVKNRQIKNWEYEKDVFIFEKIISGTRTYRPDFKVFNNSGLFEYHEVKGWMDQKSKTKLKRMKTYYPSVKLVLIDRDAYNDIKKKLGPMLKFF